MIRALLLCMFLLSGGAQAGVTDDEVAEIRAVIHRQIDAFKRDDARGAFALVSPDAQQVFGTPERFLDVVRVSYRAVYRPAEIRFLGLTLIGAEAVQQVQLVDRSGAVWHAYYAMQRQKDGSWRTHGCRLVHPAKTIPT